MKTVLSKDQINRVGALSWRANVANIELSAFDNVIASNKAELKRLLSQVKDCENTINEMANSDAKQKLDIRVKTCHAEIEKILNIKVV